MYIERQTRDYLEDKHKWEDISKLCVGRGWSYWLDLTQEKNKYWDLVNTEINFPGREFLA
jgi:hypothetical protein